MNFGKVFDGKTYLDNLTGREKALVMQQFEMHVRLKRADAPAWGLYQKEAEL